MSDGYGKYLSKEEQFVSDLLVSEPEKFSVGIAEDFDRGVVIIFDDRTYILEKNRAIALSEAIAFAAAKSDPGSIQ